MYAVESLYDIIPNDFFIYIQEDLEQTQRSRGRWFFERLSAISDRTKIVPRDFDRTTLIKNSVATASLGNKYGWRAIDEGKPLILFGEAWYKNITGVHPFSINIDWNSIINYRKNDTEFEGSLNALYNTTYPGQIRSPKKDTNLSTETLQEIILKLQA
jgi:hypothetical protein